MAKKPAKRKNRPRKHIIADMSLHHVAFLVSACGYTVEPTRNDYGYDLSVFTFDPTGAYENGNIFVQLKATDHIRIAKRTGNVKFNISKSDIMTWEAEHFPVYLVVFDAIGRVAYQLYLQRYFQSNNIKSTAMTTESLEVSLPATVLTEPAIRVWRDEKNAILKRLGAATHV